MDSDIARILGLSQTEAVVAAFACGIVLGAMISRIAFGGGGGSNGSARWSARGPAQGPARAYERAPMHHAAGPELRRITSRNYAALLQVAQTAAANAPWRAAGRLAIALERGSSWRMPRNRPDTEQVARDLAESMRSNLAAAIDAGNAVVGANDLSDAAERRAVAQAVKRAGDGLSIDFWERHGALIRGSAMPASLKTKFENFFGQVAALKKAIAALPADPAPAQLAHIVEGVVELLNTAAAIAEEIEKIATA